MRNTELITDKRILGSMIARRRFLNYMDNRGQRDEGKLRDSILLINIHQGAARGFFIVAGGTKCSYLAVTREEKSQEPIYVIDC